MDLQLDSPVQYVSRVGPSMAGKLKKRLGIETVYDLLTYVPFRYDDFSVVSPIGRLQPGETVTVIGTLTSLKTFVTKRGKRLVMGTVSDDSGSIGVTWFNQQYLIKVLHPGDTVSLSGKVDWFGTKRVITSPVYEVIEQSGSGHPGLHTGRLVPIYPETEGVSSKWLRGRIAYVLEHCLEKVPERLPQETIRKQQLPSIQEAISSIHFPLNQAAAARARDRLAFEEMLTLLLTSYRQKRIWQTTLIAAALPLPSDTRAAFTGSLPFILTGDQITASGEILADMAKQIPMNRLLEGDVGAGKTVVAAFGMFASYINGRSAVLMAPTQILAEQHHKTLSGILAPHHISVELIIGGTKTTKPKKVKQPGPRLIVGTHALLTSGTLPSSVGLIVIDEQQRFGVAQRAKLRELFHTKRVPHQLIMTATPIPRTLAQTVFGDMELSVLHSMPKGRKQVRTWVVPGGKRAAAYRWIADELTKNKGQAFVVCPLIDESESLQTVRAASSEYERLKSKEFPHLSVGLLHGRMKPDEKSRILTAFRNHAYDILVTTPVVEVGIDIPDATVILIEAAERFGLSQLHQLRGRVGRGSMNSYCLLFTEIEEEAVLTRLKAMETVHNGPELAELDLSLRGPGDLFGTRQHGVSGLTLTRLTDTAMISRAKAEMTRITDKDPDLTSFTHLRLTEKKDTIEMSHA